MHRAEHSQHTIRIDEKDATGIVAVEPAGPFIRVFRRAANDITFHDYPFKPFVLITDPALIDRSPVVTTRQQLEGSGALRWLVQTSNWHDWCLLRDYLHQSARPEEWFGIPDACQQFLVARGAAFFRGLSFREVTVLCISIETAEHEQLPLRRGHQCQQSVKAIAVADTTGYEDYVSRKDGLTEQELLKWLSAIIRERDPDLITGYRLTGQDLPCLIRRSGLHGLQLHLGRDGSEPHQLQSADPHRRQKGFGIYGRSVIDTVALVRQYEQQIRPLPGHELQQVAAWFGCSVRQDTLIPAVVADLRETVRLYQQLAPVWHYQVQLYPASFQTLVARPGTYAVRALLLQQYLQKRHAVPAPASGDRLTEQRSGEIFKRGQAGPVVICDSSELPASIMLAYRIAPCGDEIGSFLSLLCAQTHPASRIPGPRSPLQPAWFELLSQNRYPFSDLQAAHEVKRLVRVVTGDLLGWLREEGAEPVFADQQEICFVPPPGYSGDEIIQRLNKRLVELIPEALPLRCCGQYQSMFVYSLNKYALLEQNGTVVYRGHGFAYHSMEPYLLEFLKEALALLLASRAEEIRTLHADYLRKLVVHDCTITWLMRTEALADTLEKYQQGVQSGKRNRAAVYELALSAPETWKVGDTISYYVAGNSKHAAAHESCRFATDFDPSRPDMNIPWYAERLHQLFKRLEPFLPPEPTLF